MRRMLVWSRLLVIAVCAALVVDVGAVTAQSAGNGLEERSVNDFDFDPDRGVVRVTIDIDLRNVTTDRVDGDLVSRTYFDEYVVAVPLGAENIVAVRDGTVLAGTLVSDPEFPAFSTYRFALDTRLFSGESTTVRVTYDHLGAPPRDRVPWRVNEAYAGFVAFGLGDDGLVTVRITQPAGYVFDEFTDLSGFEVSAPDASGAVVYSRAGLTEDARITVGMANDDRLVPRPLSVSGVDIELRSWPDDPEWADFAAGRVESGIPALEELIGIGWPVEGSFRVRQTVEPNLYGYAGWFDGRTNEIAVGEALDADTIYHELSHAWFNSLLSTERWLTEGLAQVYAAELIGRDGQDPRVPSEPDPADPNATALTDWTGIGTERAVEEYGYNSSFWVLDAMIDEIGFERTRDVVAALRDGTSAYDPTAPGARPEDDWKRAYDAFTEIGGATTANDLFRVHVVGPGDAALVERRDRVRNEVADLDARSAPWDLPVGIRNRLERWELDDVDVGLAAADVVLVQRSDLEAIEEVVGIDEPDRAGDAYAAAPMDDRGGVDFAEATAILDQALELGERLEDQLVEVGALAVLAGTTAPALGSMPGVDDFATGLDAAAEQLGALERVVEVEQELDEASGLLATIGRWGSDIERDLDDARAEFERGDNEAAIATLEDAEARIDDLAAAGARRLAIAGTVVAAAFVAIILIRRRTRPTVSAPEGTDPGTL